MNDKHWYSSSVSVDRLIDEAVGYMEAILATEAPNFCQNDADYLRSVFKECKLQIEHLEDLIKECKHDRT